MCKYHFYIPSEKGFIKYLDKQNELISWKEKLLLKTCSEPFKDKENEVLYRVKEINNLYSTFLCEKVEDMATWIANEEKLSHEKIKNEKVINGEFEYNPVKRIRSALKKEGFKRDYLSFATKYCHHYKPNTYPIYDSVNVRVLNVFMAYKDKRNYEEYVWYYDKFCEELKLSKGYREFQRENQDDFSLDEEGFYIDKYIQYIGGRKP